MQLDEFDIEAFIAEKSTQTGRSPFVKDLEIEIMLERWSIKSKSGRIKEIEPNKDYLVVHDFILDKVEQGLLTQDQADHIQRSCENVNVVGRPEAIKKAIIAANPNLAEEVKNLGGRHKK